MEAQLAGVCRPSLKGQTFDCLGNVNYHGKKVSDPDTRAKLQTLGRVLNKEIHVTSGDRSETDQKRLLSQGQHPAKDSQHLHGTAADISVEGMTPPQVAPIAREVGFTGIGIYPKHLHVDTRPKPAMWYGKD